MPAPVAPTRPAPRDRPGSHTAFPDLGPFDYVNSAAMTAFMDWAEAQMEYQVQIPVGPIWYKGSGKPGIVIDRGVGLPSDDEEFMPGLRFQGYTDDDAAAPINFYWASAEFGFAFTYNTYRSQLGGQLNGADTANTVAFTFGLDTFEGPESGIGIQFCAPYIPEGLVPGVAPTHNGPGWDFNGGSKYLLGVQGSGDYIPGPQTVGQGTSTGSNTTNTLNDTSFKTYTGQATWGYNFYVTNVPCTIQITGGTGSGSNLYTVISNTANTITISGTWANGTPDNTSTYTIISPNLHQVAAAMGVFGFGPGMDAEYRLGANLGDVPNWIAISAIGSRPFAHTNQQLWIRQFNNYFPAANPGSDYGYQAPSFIFDMPTGNMTAIGTMTGLNITPLIGAVMHQQQPAYSSTMAIDASLGGAIFVLPLDGNAFTIANPTNVTSGQVLVFLIDNNAGFTGGTLGAITWDTHFHLAGAFTNPAGNKIRVISFYCANATTIREISRTAADQ